MMELSVPVMLYWVLMFYSIFHSLLNILAEITCFGDRLFYLVSSLLFRIGGIVKIINSIGRNGIYQFIIGC